MWDLLQADCSQSYRRIHDLLSLKGCQVNHKRVWRLYKLANLSVRKRRKVKRRIVCVGDSCPQSMSMARVWRRPSNG